MLASGIIQSILLIVYMHVCSGGAENLFDNVKTRQVELDSSKTSRKHLPFSFFFIMHHYLSNFIAFSETIKDLLMWIKDNILRERPELFLQDDTV